MATTIGSLALKITAGVGDLKARLTEGLGYVGGFAKMANHALRQTFSGIGGMLASTFTGGDPFRLLAESAKNLVGSVPYIGGFAAAGIGLFEGLLGKLQSTIDRIDELRKVSLALGTSMEEISILSELFGDDFDKAAKAINGLQEKLGDATSGGKQAAAMFASLGLNANELIQQRTIDQLGAIGDSLLALPNAFQRAWVASQLFGGKADDLLPYLLKGSAGIKQFEAKLRSMGVLLNDADAAAAMAAKQGLKDFHRILDGIWTRIAMDVVPILLKLQKEFTSTGGHAISVAETVRQVAKVLAKSAVEVANKWNTVHAVFIFMKGSIQAIGLAMAKAVRYIAEGLLELEKLMGDDAVVAQHEKQIEFMKAGERGIVEEMEKTAARFQELWGGDDVNAALKKIDDFFNNLGKEPPAAGKGWFSRQMETDLRNLKRMQELFDKMQGKLESNKSPFEKWKDDVEEMRQALAMGVIDAVSFDRLLMRSTQDLLNQQKHDNKPPEALMRGTAAAFSAINAFERGGDKNNPMVELKRIAEEELKVQRDLEKNMRELLDAVRESGLRALGF